MTTVMSKSKADEKKKIFIALRDLCGKDFEIEQDGKSGLCTVKNDVDPLREFEEGLEKTGCIDYHYSDNHEKLKTKKLSDFTFENCCTELTFYLRGERFSYGFFYNHLKDKTIFKLLVRAVEVIPQS